MKVILQEKGSVAATIETDGIISLKGSTLTYKKKIEKIDGKTKKVTLIDGPIVSIELDEPSIAWCKKNKVGG